jgi:hypothetical protein
VHAPSEDKCDYSKDSFYEVFYDFPKYHTKILLGDFNAKMGRENIFKPTKGNESLHQDSNDNDIRIVNIDKTKKKIWLVTAFCSQTEIFVSTPGSLLMGRLTARLITY